MNEMGYSYKASITCVIVLLAIFGALSFLFSCNTLPQLYQSIDDIATDDAVTIKVDRDCFQKDTDVSISVQVKNKDETK